MKTAIIYGTKTGTTRKVAKALADKIKGDVVTIPIAKAKSTCLLKYDFIIIAGSIHYGKIQGDVKSFVNKNSKTLHGLNYGLYLMCINEEESESYFSKSFGDEIVNSSFIHASFGGELNSSKGGFLSKHISKAILKGFEKDNKDIPTIKWNLVDDFANKINESIAILDKNAN